MASYKDTEHSTVSFLYKLSTGISTNSYAMNVCNLAGVPNGTINFLFSNFFQNF
jgi:DNA mismatch repair ATPase MutS